MTGRQETFTAGSVDEVASTFNQLIRICKDGENGFASAASAVEEPALQRLFQSFSQQRTEFAAELELEVRRLAQDPVESGHASAALLRSWLDIKAGVMGLSDEQVIYQCEGEEETALEHYGRALNSHLPHDLRLIVERQFIQIQEAHQQIRSLEQTLDGSK